MSEKPKKSLTLPMRAITGAALLFISQLTHAAELIIEPDMGREPLLQAINNSQHSIHLVMYGFTDETLLNSIVHQNKKVNVILEKQPYKMTDENTKAIKQLNKANIQWMGGSPDYQLTHQKTLIIDDKQAVVMTFNFTKSTFKKNNQLNFAIVTDNPSEIKDILAHFAADWKRKPITSTAPNLIWSPENSRAKITAMISSAKQQIDIYAQNISDTQIINALIQAANRGIKINILTSINLSNKLDHPNITIHLNKKPYIHAKAMIIDHQKAMVGSINFTRTSLDNNRELSIITTNPAIIKKLEDKMYML